MRQETEGGTRATFTEEGEEEKNSSGKYEEEEDKIKRQTRLINANNFLVKCHYDQWPCLQRQTSLRSCLLLFSFVTARLPKPRISSLSMASSYKESVDRHWFRVIASIRWVNYSAIRLFNSDQIKGTPSTYHRRQNGLAKVPDTGCIRNSCSFNRSLMC